MSKGPDKKKAAKDKSAAKSKKADKQPKALAAEAAAPASTKKAAKAPAPATIKAKPKAEAAPAKTAPAKTTPAKAAAPKAAPVKKASAPKSRAEAPKAAAPKAAAPGGDAPKAAPRPEASTEQGRAKAFEASGFMNLAQELTPEQLKSLESLSANLAKAAMTAQGALAESALRQAERPAALSTDPFHIAPALAEVASQLANRPDNLMRAQADLFQRYMQLWSQTTRRLYGEETAPVVEPGRGDKRFNDPEWKDNPIFDVMKQSYLVTSNWLNDLVGQVEGVDPLSKRRVEFFTKMLTDAIAPSNFLISNPAALRKAMESKGESILKGAENFAADLARGGGPLAISQTEASKFKVGENVATAPGKVVYRNALFELLQYSPTTEEVFEIPLLIFPPWINKFYILDLRAENSMIRWLTSQGITVFVTSWVNPSPELAGATLEDYMRLGQYEAVAQVKKQCGVDHVNTVGYCIGGTLLSCTLAHMAAKGDTSIGSATFFAAQQDFSEAGDLLIFTNEEWLSDLEKRMDAAGGVLPGSAMAETFNMLRANDLIWSFFVNNYLMGKDPTPFDLLFWNSDQTRMPKTLHLQYLRRMYQENALARRELVFDNVRLDLAEVKIPVYVQASREDHIAPFRSVYKGARLFGGPTRLTLAGSGHIAGVVNHPDAKKYQHWTNDALPETPEAWLGEAVEHPGSWWPHWARWLTALSGGKVPARDPSKGPLKALGEAPGDYVKVRSDEA
jgi:polyhydroxyalkanoate synthase